MLGYVGGKMESIEMGFNGAACKRLATDEPAASLQQAHPET